MAAWKAEDWKSAVKAVAPTLGGLLATFGGPAGVLAGAGITAVANALGVPDNEESVSAAMQAGLSPEQKAALVAADLDYKKAMIEAGLRSQEINAGVEKAYIADVADARAHNANTVGILRLGYIINIASYSTVAAVLFGCYRLATGGKLDMDAGSAAMIGGIVGSALQWVISNSTQSNGFFFGSSPSSRQVATDLGKAASMQPPSTKA